VIDRQIQRASRFGHFSDEPAEGEGELDRAAKAAAKAGKPKAIRFTAEQKKIVSDISHSRDATRILKSRNSSGSLSSSAEFDGGANGQAMSATERMSMNIRGLSSSGRHSGNRDSRDSEGSRDRQPSGGSVRLGRPYSSSGGRISPPVEPTADAHRSEEGELATRLGRVEQQVDGLRSSLCAEMAGVGTQLEALSQMMARATAAQQADLFVPRVAECVRDAVAQGVAPLAEEVSRVARTGAKLKREVLRARGAHATAAAIAHHAHQPGFVAAHGP
jgi:hypothetical protein